MDLDEISTSSRDRTPSPSSTTRTQRRDLHTEIKERGRQENTSDSEDTIPYPVDNKQEDLDETEPSFAMWGIKRKVKDDEDATGTFDFTYSERPDLGMTRDDEDEELTRLDNWIKEIEKFKSDRGITTNSQGEFEYTYFDGYNRRTITKLTTKGDKSIEEMIDEV
jgi:hypothetical protein